MYEAQGGDDECCSSRDLSATIWGRVVFQDEERVKGKHYGIGARKIRFVPKLLYVAAVFFNPIAHDKEASVHTYPSTLPIAKASPGSLAHRSGGNHQQLPWSFHVPSRPARPPGT